MKYGRYRHCLLIRIRYQIESVSIETIRKTNVRVFKKVAYMYGGLGRIMAVIVIGSSAQLICCTGVKPQRYFSSLEAVEHPHQVLES
jgi:hypothetical protein